MTIARLGDGRWHQTRASAGVNDGPWPVFGGALKRPVNPLFPRVPHSELSNANDDRMTVLA